MRWCLLTMMNVRACCLVMGLIFATGCESATDVVNQHRAAVEAKRTKILAAAKAPANASAPALTDKLIFEGESANAIVVLRELLETPPTNPTHDLIKKYDLWKSVRDAVAEPGKRNTKLLRSELTQFENIRYVVVLSTWSFYEGRRKSDATFEGGSWSGAITILDVDKGASLGTITASSSSSDTITAKQGSVNSALRSDVYSHAAAAINAELAKFMAPGHRAL